MDVKELPSNRPGKLNGRTFRKASVLAGAKAMVKKPAGTEKALAPPAALFALPPGPTKPSMDPALAAFAAKLPEIETIEDFDEWALAYRATFSLVQRLKK
jgi:hypothetical protein